MKEAYGNSSLTWQHVCRVARYAIEFGKSVGLSGEALLSLQCAALLHEVGKSLIDPALIGKDTPLDRDEWYMITKHMTLLMNKLKLHELPGSILRFVQSYSERYDGSGYPQGLVGTEIPQASRVLSIADAFETMASDRPYRAAYNSDRIVDEFTKGAGTQFDPDILRKVWSQLQVEAVDPPTPGSIRLITKDAELIRQIWCAVMPHGWELHIWPTSFEPSYPAELALIRQSNLENATLTIVDRRCVGQLSPELLAGLPADAVWIGKPNKSRPTLEMPLDLRDIMTMIYGNSTTDWSSTSPPKIRAILADPYHIFRQALRRYLDGVDDVEVICEVSSPQDFRNAIAQHSFDVVIVASDLLSGTHTTSPLSEGDLRLEQAQVITGPLYPQPTIVLVADEDTNDYNVGLYDAPLPGNISNFVYIHRGAPAERLIAAIRVMLKS
jgi:hypothetical protein